MSSSYWLSVLPTLTFPVCPSFGSVNNGFARFFLGHFGECQGTLGEDFLGGDSPMDFELSDYVIRGLGLVWLSVNHCVNPVICSLLF